MTTLWCVLFMFHTHMRKAPKILVSVTPQVISLTGCPLCLMFTSILLITSFKSQAVLLQKVYYGTCFHRMKSHCVRGL